MFHRETSDVEHMEALIQDAIRQILSDPRPGPFLQWSQRTMPSLLGADSSELIPSEASRLSLLLGAAIWNATPLPRNDFQPQPLHAQDIAPTCPCGSGKAFPLCCGEDEQIPELPEELIWECLIVSADADTLSEAIGAGAIPPELLYCVGERLLADDHPGRAVALLEPLFSRLDDPAQLADGEAALILAPALDPFCDALDRLDHWKKKLRFLKDMSACSERPLRALAWQRRCTIAIDDGAFDAARQAFEQAQRNAPDDANTALLEITLLAAQHDNDHAAARARFWYHKLKRAGCDDETLLQFFSAAAIDAQSALLASQADLIDPRLLLLHALIEKACERRIPRYTLDLITDTRQSPPSPQLSLSLEMPDEVAAVHDDLLAARLVPARGLRRLENTWRELFRCNKPPATQLIVRDSPCWELTAWLDLLRREPRCFDSLDILDDIATALYLHPESALPWVAQTLLLPLLERAFEIVAASLDDDKRLTLPWSDERNRPALRLLFRLHLHHSDAGEHTAAVPFMEMLLRLNPSDNHGIRAELINHYLRQHQDAAAVELAARFPNDVLADTAYGEVLALYRLGEHKRAAAALDQAIGALPLIPRYLTRKRVRQPQVGALGLVPGSDGQAWSYREAMRAVWEAEPGVLDWMKRLAP